MSSIGVVLDACVLFPGVLRDTLLHAAKADLYRLCLTAEILEEARRNLVKRGHMTEEQGQHLVDQIKKNFKSAFVTRHTILIPSMPVNEKDRHVLAAAVASNSEIIVTQNLKDFPPHLLEPLQIEALSPDDFLVHQFSLDQETVIDVLKAQVSTLTRPPLTMLEMLVKLEKQTPNFVRIIRRSLYG